MTQPSADQPDASSPDQRVPHTPRRAGANVVRTPMRLNLTAMIDVIFLLLIYFVLTAAFTQGEGVIAAKLPSGSGPSAGPEPPKRELKIRLAEVGRSGVAISVQRERPRSFAELASMLERWRFGPNNPAGIYKDDSPILIEPEGNVRWQHVVNAFNAAVKAKYRNVSFAQVKE